VHGDFPDEAFCDTLIAEPTPTILCKCDQTAAVAISQPHLATSTMPLCCAGVTFERATVR
jgi:hypothetical protein